MDGQPVGSAGAAKVLEVNRRRIIMWLRDKEKLKSKINANPKLTKVKQVHAGMTASTADIEEALNDYINKHRGCGSNEVMNKLLELKPDTLGGLPATARPEEALASSDQFKCWYQRFRKRRGFSIRRRTSVGQRLSTGHVGMAWATLMKLRMERPCEIYARRNPPACGDSPIKGEAGVGDRRSVRRTRQNGPDANPARDAGGDNSGEARCEGCSHQHNR